MKTGCIWYCIVHFPVMLCAIFLDGTCQILSHIVRLKSALTSIIEPDFGLLNELLRLEVLTYNQYIKLRSGDKAAFERNDAMLDLLVSEDQCDKLMKALQQTSQQHVVNFVMQNGGQ